MSSPCEPWQAGKKGAATSRDAHGKAIALPGCSCHTAAPYCRCGMCSPRPDLSHAGVCLLWFWPLFSICTSVISQWQSCQQAALKNLLRSSWHLQIQQSPWQIAQDSVGKAPPYQLMENICTTPYAIFGNLILRNHPVKIRLKKNKITVFTIQFSSPPIYPPSLLFSGQYFITQCTKRRKKCKQKKIYLLGCKFIPHFPDSTKWLLFQYIPQPKFCTPIAPKSWSAIRRRKKEDFHCSCCCQKLSYEHIRKTRGRRRTGWSMLHRFRFWFSSPEMPPAHSNKQTCLSGLKILHNGTTKCRFWLKLQKNSVGWTWFENYSP